MSLEHLWAPWRMDYIKNKESVVECIFCEAWTRGAHKDTLVLSTSKRAFVIMNRYPYNAGHIMVVPSEHKSDIHDLTDESYSELFQVVRAAKLALDKAMQPAGFNVGINLGAAAGAGIANHLHVHILPRWQGDTNFMPLLAETTVLPEHLDATYDKLMPYFQEIEV